MKVIKSIVEIRNKVNTLKSNGETIGLIPTMGALHEGHLSLVKKSTEINNITICSIYVNPAQFNKKEDFNNYPITIEQDIEFLTNANCDILFIPKSEEIYSSKPVLSFAFGSLESRMEGMHRTGHFNGVGLIVSKLLNIIQPQTAFFGQKDFQQVAIVKQLVKDLSFATKIHSCPTLREESGLAMSSRNKRLSNSEKTEAAKIYDSLLLAKKLINNTIPFDKIMSQIKQFYANSLLELEYFEIVDSNSLEPVRDMNRDNIVICVAAFLGNVRLIDNVVL